ncbi:MAG: hypothetical protein MZV64_24170 [Ignavibacteriales bacterium]|nr:hypothetical protein [Ignavibacteriales bacterium]
MSCKPRPCKAAARSLCSTWASLSASSTLPKTSSSFRVSSRTRISRSPSRAFDLAKNLRKNSGTLILPSCRLYTPTFPDSTSLRPCQPRT